ncbi:MAG: hypothetical protein GX577_09255 [Leptolinea sp.]|nr:hypothetical protein [Leptolinea sp.]
MKTISNTKLINRNKKIGQILTFVAVAILIGGLVLSLQGKVEYITYSYMALIIGFLVSQFGIYFSNKFGRSPRPDEQISAALKGLDDRYSLYHYATSASHLLVGPSGIWVILPYQQRGTITYEKGKYRQKGGNWYLKLFAQEGLGRPDKEAQYATEDIQKYFARQMDEDKVPTVNPLLIFTNPKAKVDALDAPYATVGADKVKDFLRKKAKDNAFPLERVQQVNAVILPPDAPQEEMKK